MKSLKFTVTAIAIGCLAVVTVHAGAITGKVTFSGKPRPAKKLNMAADPVCTTLHTTSARDEKFVVGEGADQVYPLANVFVYVKSGAEKKDYPMPSGPLVIDQEGCKYIPHVAGARVGQEIQFKNSDKTMHNVHSLSKGSAPFNRGMPAGSPNASYKLAKSEVMVKMKCDAHPWMSCYIGAMEHPFFAVTGKDGSFTLDGLPDGEYEVEAWQELLKTKVAKVTVSGGSGSVNFEYTKPKKK
jgi:plastocyanin